MLYSPNVRKKLEPATTSIKTQSRTSQRTTSTETFSLVGTHVSEDEDSNNTSRTSKNGTRTKDSNEYLRSTFIDLIDNNQSVNNDIQVIDLIKSQFDIQTVRIRRLERALKKEEVDNEDILNILLKKYPNAMKHYKQQIQQDQFNEQLEVCIDQFEAQKQKMILEHQRNFEILKLKYRNRFDDIVERMINDPSRLDDEWAKRVQREANDRIEEIKRKYSASASSFSGSM